MYFKFLYQLSSWIIFTIIGPFVYMLFPKEWVSVGNGFGKYKIKLIDNIWGNRDDGLSGDKPYRNNEAKKYKSMYLSSMVWSCFRNPVGNGKRSIFSASGCINNVKIKSNTKIITMEDGSRWFFYHPIFKNGIAIRLGWKFWEDATIGNNYVAKLGFSACKK